MHSWRRASFLNTVWNCSKLSLKDIARRSNGLPSPNLTRISFCADICWICYTVFTSKYHRYNLLEEENCGTLRDSDFASVYFLNLPSFVVRRELRATATHVAKFKTDVEREKLERWKFYDAIARSVLSESFNPFIDNCRTYVRFVAKEMIKYPNFKSDFLMGMAIFDYSTLTVLLCLRAIGCYAPLFQKFSSRGQLARERRILTWTTTCSLLMMSAMFVWMPLFLDRSSMISSPFVLNCPELATRDKRLFHSTCIACVWAMCFHHCGQYELVLLCVAQVRLTCLLWLSLSRVFFCPTKCEETSLQIPNQLRSVSNLLTLSEVGHC